MSKAHIAYRSHHFAAAAATIASPLPSPAMSINDSINPWANISMSAPSTPALGAPTALHAKDLPTPSVVYSNSTQPIISFDGSRQSKDVINDVFLSSTMLYDDVELYLNESSSSAFDSDSDSGFSTPSQHEEEQACFSTPMTPMSPFMENDAEDQLYAAEEADDQACLPEQQQHSEETKVIFDDVANMVVDMKRPMFIPVSICDARDFAAMASLPTPPECNARKHSYDFLSNSDAFLLGGISATKRRRMLSVDMMSDAPASPPASNAGDDEVAELSDTDSTADSFMARRRSLFQMRNVRHLTPISPSMPEIVCFAPPTHEEYEYHPELDHSDDEEEEEEDYEVDFTKNVTTESAVPSDLFVVEAEQEVGQSADLSDYSSSDDEAEFGYHTENRMQIDGMSSSDDSDSDLSDVDDYQPPTRRRGTWHGPSLEEIERATARKMKVKSSGPRPSPLAKSCHTASKPSTEIKAETAVAAAPVATAISAPVPVAATSATKVASELKQSKAPTLFQILTKANIDWCRYCGTTEGVNWRPGPWGKRTLCNKHGCDFKGYGFACKLPRLDLTSYVHETVDQRIRPVLQHFCHGCQSQESTADNVMVRCEGCPKAFHQMCHGETRISDEIALSDKPWFCDETCKENVKKRRVCVELPKKRLPLMSTPKPASAAASAAATAIMASAAGGAAAGSGSLAAAGSASETVRSRGMRVSISGEITTSRK
ncbi:hypothetical protein BGZ99_000156 [Dissophora globulifera]|uniref:PHD-type domain-containing protein n=1 Tax=Dissophora globulifera TaxID=979702 RepID=A0A9P6UYD7_9FUNG|nr:hypothetical protein BGZ99_000156 [Dissophora globulifera]